MKKKKITKFPKKFFTVLLLDILFLIVFITLINVAILSYKANIQSVYKLQTSIFGSNMPSKPTPEFMKKLEDNLDIVKNTLSGFLKGIALITILSFVLAVAIVSYFKGLVWCKISKNRFTKKFLIKFSAIHALWYLFWISLLALIIFGIKTQLRVYFFFTWLFLCIYFSLLLKPIFMINQNIWPTLKNITRISIFYFYRYLPIFLGITLLFVLIFIPIALLVNHIPETLLAILFITVLLLFSTSLKFFLYLFVKKLNNQKC